MATDAAASLRERGIQVTAQRLAVLRAVSGQPHIAADAVAEVVRTEIGAISLQSVYDTLGLLVAEGLVRRIQPSGSPARFEDRVGDNHHHLICRTCGRVVDVDCAAGAAPCLTPHDDRGYQIDEAEVAYWGRCPDCLERSRPAGTRLTVAPGRRGTAHKTPRTKPPGGGTSRPRTTNRRTRRSSRD
jgi:Fur family transcriptional regulator, stress-responsive regulator